MHKRRLVTVAASLLIFIQAGCGTTLVRNPLPPTHTATPTPSLTPTPTNTLSPTPTSFGGGGGKLAYTSNRGGYSDIHTIDVDGSNITQLTSSPRFDQSIAWSPDGSKIAFTSGSYWKREVYVIDADGSNQIQLTDNPIIYVDVTWSPDGHRVAFIGRVGEDPPDGEPWSSENDLYVIDADGSNLTRLTEHSYDFIRSIDWSPVGNQIVAAASEFNKSNLLIFDVDEGTMYKVLGAIFTYAGVQSPIWSPDGQKIAYFCSFGTNWEIFVVDKEGGIPTRLTFHPAMDRYPIWSPDGEKILFTSWRDGRDFYIIDADGTNLTRLTNNQADNRNPNGLQMELRSSLSPALATIGISTLWTQMGAI
jgi:Tol biopolymer transport system component